jgi:SAM-dependent methyltransferase
MSDGPRACPQDWEGRYRAGDVPWDLGRAPPVLERLLERLSGQTLRVFVPGCGRGHDALAWARAGHRVTALDLAPTALAQARERAGAAGLPLDLRVGDVLDPPPDLQGAFDAVWEQTCFCVFPPERRAAYVEAVADVLAPGGRLHALLWAHGASGGPPYDVRRGDARRLFAARFQDLRVEDVPAWNDARWDEFLLTGTRAG